MAATKRTEEMILADRAFIAEKYLTGWSQAAIAAERGMTQQMVSYDLQALYDEWYARSALATDELRAEESARIDRLEREYWQAWIDSRAEFTESSSEMIEAGEGSTARTKTRLVTKRKEGNPSFLAGVQWCIDRRSKLWGLDKMPALQQKATTDWDMISDEQLLIESREAAANPPPADTAGAGAPRPGQVTITEEHVTPAGE